MNPFRRCQFLHVFILMIILLLLESHGASAIRFPNRITQVPIEQSDDQLLKSAVFALGSFWRSESVFGCLDGVVRTTVGYAGGSKPNPEYRSLGDHAESVHKCKSKVAYTDVLPATHANRGALAPVIALFSFISMCLEHRQLASAMVERIEYDPRLINFRQLLEVFWSSHDSRQVFGQGPDVGNQYRSIIFTNGTEELRLAALSKEREQTRSRSSIVTTQIQQLGTFYPAEPEHQKFELKRNPFLLQLIGNLPEEELEKSSLAAKLNGYAAELCSPRIQGRIDGKISDIIRKGWPILRDI